MPQAPDSDPGKATGKGMDEAEVLMYFKVEPRSGGYRAMFYGDNHELVWMTEVYKYVAGAQHAISLAKTYAPNAPVYGP